MLPHSPFLAHIRVHSFLLGQRFFYVERLCS